MSLSIAGRAVGEAARDQVYAALRRGIVHTELLHLPGDRAAVRAATVAHALAGVRLRATPL